MTTLSTFGAKRTIKNNFNAIFVVSSFIFTY